MRDLILKMSISIDGFVGGPDGGIKIWNASLHIMGSRTFHDMAAYWPTSTEVFAAPMNQIPKAVFSRHRAWRSQLRPQSRRPGTHRPI